MGYALITGGGTDGLYQIELDWGAAQKASLLATLDAAQTVVLGKIAVQQVAVDAATAAEAQQAAFLANLVSNYAAAEAALPPEQKGQTIDAFRQVYDVELKRLFDMRAQNSPKRAALDALNTNLTEILRRAAYWNNFVATETRDAWCVDLTEDATDYVATIDIPGESDTILIAEGGRAWVGWDGTISTGTKTATLTVLQLRLDSKTAENVALTARIATTLAEVPQLRTNVADANTAYMAAPSEQTLATVNLATKALNDKLEDLAALNATLAVVNQSIADIGKLIVTWTNKPSSDAPVYGDGRFDAREIMSPEQSYFNAAILPGWQKDKPTYRVGTLTVIDRDANTATVELEEAVSSALGDTSQELNINREDTLEGVEFEYMDCHDMAFQEGDTVVVKFENLSWDEPKIIGFLDHPRGCSWYVMGCFANTHIAVTTAEGVADLATLNAGGGTIECRIDRGAWQALAQNTPGLPASYWGHFFTAGDDQFAYCYIQQSFTFPGTTPDPSVLGAVSIHLGPDLTAGTDQIIEVRAMIGPRLIFNAACIDIGIGSANEDNMRARSTGGILNNWVGSYPVAPLLDYLMFADNGT